MCTQIALSVCRPVHIFVWARFCVLRQKSHFGNQVLPFLHFRLARCVHAMCLNTNRYDGNEVAAPRPGAQTCFDGETVVGIPAAYRSSIVSPLGFLLAFCCLIVAGGCPFLDKDWHKFLPESLDRHKGVEP